MPDYSQVKALLDEQAASGPVADAWAAHQKRARVVAVQMEEVLTSDAWATLRKHVEALLEVVTADLEATQAGLLSVELVGSPLLQAKLRAVRLAGLQEAYQTVLGLPAMVQLQVKAMDPKGDAS